MKKGKSNEDKLDTTHFLAGVTASWMKLIQEAVKNDPTKEMISFLRDEMEKSGEHELKLQYFNSCLVTEPIHASPSLSFFLLTCTFTLIMNSILRAFRG